MRQLYESPDTYMIINSYRFSSGGGGGTGLDSNLVAWYDCIGDLNDNHGSLNWTENGTFSKAITDPFGNSNSACGGDGTTAQYGTQTDPAFDLTGDLSACCWIKARAAGDRCAEFLSKAGGSGNRGWDFGYRNSGGTDDVSIHLSSTGNWEYTENSNAWLANGSWYHLGFSYDSSAREVKLYVDGALKQTDTNPSPTVPASIYDSSDDMTLCGHNGGSDIVGNVDFCRIGIWSAVLAGTDFSTIYNSGSDFRYSDI